MYQLYVLQNQYLILGFLGGAALVLGVILAYVAIWRPRREGGQPQEIATGRPSTLGWLRTFLPWFLIVIYVAAAVYALVYTLTIARSDPNW